MNRLSQTIGDEEGVILVHVLGLLAFASAIVFLMLRLQDLSIDQAQRSSDQLQAIEIARGVESSIAVAFRRDALSEDRTDHYGEPWAQAGQEALEIEGGSIEVNVSDAQSGFNINRLVDGRLTDTAMFSKVARAAGLTSASELAVVQALSSTGPIGDVRDLQNFGLGSEECERLAEFATALPGPAPINANTANEQVLNAVIGNPGVIARIMALREREGHLTREALSQAGVLLPTGVGLETSHLYVEIRVTHGDARLKRRSTIARRTEAEGALADVIARAPST